MSNMSFIFLFATLTFQLVYGNKVTSTTESPATFSDKYLEVNTTTGVLKGFFGKSCRNEINFAGFRGIPYAEPPVGKLRFKDPVEKAKWNGVYNATYQRSGCIQGSFDKSAPVPSVGFSEDCLYLNVYTPNVKYLQNDKSPLKSVMVFIHGGAFLLGSSYENEVSPDFLLEKDIVLVTLNYRLGAFGFLSLQTSEVSGNAGLKDQNMALKWVKKNIRAFGGDPEKITLFGESAGAASVNYHLLSPESKGLFQKAILESGTVLSLWAYSLPETALDRAHKLGKKLKCKKSKNVDRLLECLQNVPASKLAGMQQQVITLQDLAAMDIIAFEPTTEPKVSGAFLTEYPFEQLNNGNFTKVPTVIGSNSDEGLLLYPFFHNNDMANLLLTLIGMDLSRLAPNQFNLKPLSITSIQVHQAISKFYFNNKVVNKSQIFKVLELIGDVNFILPTQLTTNLMSKHSKTPIYNYYFTYDGGYAIYKAQANMTDVRGVSHADELGYIFYTPSFHKNCKGQREHNKRLSFADELVIDRMTKLWTNFAKTGNPTAELDQQIKADWKPFTLRNKNYYDIGANLTTLENLKKDTMSFWNEIITLILSKKDQRDIDTTRALINVW